MGVTTCLGHDVSLPLRLPARCHQRALQQRRHCLPHSRDRCSPNRPATPLACSQPVTFYNNLLAGKSGVNTITGFDAGDWTTNFGGEIRVGPAPPAGCSQALSCLSWRRRCTPIII
jgi:hypothetical protein